MVPRRRSNSRMSFPENQHRIGVVVPRNRIWLWHRKAISALQQRFAVDVFATATMPRYPLSLRFWMKLETKFLGKPEFIEFTSLSATPWEEVGDSDYAFILNLSEAHITHRSPIMDLRFGGCLDSIGLFATLIARKNPYLSLQLASEEQPIVASYLAIQDRIVL